MHFYRTLLSFFLIYSHFSYAEASEQPFFQASFEQPYHLSVGAVVFNKDGCVACHHFKKILGYFDVYILMRESVENGESPLDTLHRGLMEEFGVQATPIAFLGSLSGHLPDPVFSFEKTTLYIACQVDSFDPHLRDPNDPEAKSEIEWLPPEQLIPLMQRQGQLLKRVDADESEMLLRALPFMAK